MEPSDATPDLRRLDQTPPLTLDPELLERNLAALASHHPELAQRLRTTSPPQDWIPCEALDGSPTYRCPDANGRPHWLTGSSVPTERARAVVAELTQRDRNLALPGIGTGAALRVLLEETPDNLAIFVFEPADDHIAAVLRLVDLADALHAGRCVFVDGDDAAARLRAILAARPGLLPPMQLLFGQLAAPERLDQLREVCQAAYNEIIAQRREALAALEQQWQQRSPDPGSPRVAALAFTPQPAAQDWAAHLAAAGTRLGWPTLNITPATPDDMHPLGSARQLDAFAPTLTICCGHTPHLLEITLPGQVLAWHTTGDLPADVAQWNARHVAASPRIHAALHAAGVAPDKTVSGYWAVPEEQLADEPAWSPDGPLLIVGDVPDIDPAAHDIRQPAHQQLWRALLEEIAKRAATLHKHSATDLFGWARTAAGLQDIDPGVRDQILRVYPSHLRPAGIAQSVAKSAMALGRDLHVVGRGWQRLPGLTAEHHPNSADTVTAALADLRPALGVFLSDGTDPCTPVLLLAAARGWPLLVQGLPEVTTAALQGVLTEIEHYQPFSNPVALREHLQSLQADPAARTAHAARVQAHIRQYHTVENRLQEMVAWLASQA